jgi:hypothetical protein
VDGVSTAGHSDHKDLLLHQAGSLLLARKCRSGYGPLACNWRHPHTRTAWTRRTLRGNTPPLCWLEFWSLAGWRRMPHFAARPPVGSHPHHSRYTGAPNPEQPRKTGPPSRLPAIELSLWRQRISLSSLTVSPVHPGLHTSLVLATLGNNPNRIVTATVSGAWGFTIANYGASTQLVKAGHFQGAGQVQPSLKFRGPTSEPAADRDEEPRRGHNS